ncbi:hypothetical protein [Micromonospora sp. NBS 11-29]|uniref:hypothetical protein n=1 Tax=Micromonospora sp. NBS 11-29 TaxID=1960879 RepID=UPI000B76DA18|nr:hypothetical protein [Micromonospora sp. NBS 11-29]
MTAGALLLVGRAASVQFVKPFHFRLIRVLDWTTYDGWSWLDGYQLDERGDAVLRRSIFVMPAGLRTGCISPLQRVQTARRSPTERPALGAPRGGPVRGGTGPALQGR